MIARSAAIRELTCRTLPGGVESCSATISLDEGAVTTLRLSREEHDALALAMRAGARFDVVLRVASAPPITDTTDTTIRGATTP